MDEVDVAQETERKKATAKYVAWPSCAWLQLSSLTFPAGNQSYVRRLYILMLCLHFNAFPSFLGHEGGNRSPGHRLCALRPGLLVDVGRGVCPDGLRHVRLFHYRPLGHRRQGEGGRNHKRELRSLFGEGGRESKVRKS